MKQTSSHAQVAKLVRQFLKSINVDGSVRSKSYSMGSSVHVYVTDQTPEIAKMIGDYLVQFEYGHFNGMEDYYEMSNVRDDIPQVKYVFLDNNMSDEMAQTVWDFARSHFAGMENAPASYFEAHNFVNNNFHCFGSNLVWKLFTGTYEAFWDQKKAA